MKAPERPHVTNLHRARIAIYLHHTAPVTSYICRLLHSPGLRRPESPVFSESESAFV